MVLNGAKKKPDFLLQICLRMTHVTAGQPYKQVHTAFQNAVYYKTMFQVVCLLGRHFVF